MCDVLQRFRGGLVLRLIDFVYHSTIGLRVIKKKVCAVPLDLLGVALGVQRFRGGLVFEAHRLLYHSTLGLRVIKKNKKVGVGRSLGAAGCRVEVK